MQMRTITFCILVACGILQTQAATPLDQIGVSLLRQVDSSLTGAGVNLVHPEAGGTSIPPQFEVNPAVVGLSAGIFNYISSNGTSSVFPNNVGSESSHADTVGVNLYSLSAGVAPQVAHIDNYEADYFVNNVIGALLQPSISGPIVNQSFVFTGLSSSQQSTVEQAYDGYVANNN